MTDGTIIGAAKRVGFIGAVALVAFSAFAEPATELAGEWQGALDANGTQLRLVFHVSVAADGKPAERSTASIKARRAFRCRA